MDLPIEIGAFVRPIDPRAFFTASIFVLMAGKFRRSLLSLFILLTFLFPSTAIAQNTDSQNRPAFVSETERIHYGDIVDVDVVGSFEFDWRGGLTPEGFLDGGGRLDKAVFALCRTESEVAASIREQYSVLLRDPKVAVRIVDRSNRALAYVNGAVKKPQRLQLRRPLLLAELIVLSGGITDASSGEVVIFRPPNVSCRTNTPAAGPPDESAPKRISVKIEDLLGGVETANPAILSGDIVTITEAPPVFLTGGVAVPRRLNLTPDLTLSRAIAAAGGVPKDSGGRTVRIYRRRGETRILEFDTLAIREKRAEDPKLEPYDVIDVETKDGGQRKLAPMADIQEPPAEILSKLPLRIVD